MKKLVILLAILALAAPVFADVTVTCEDGGDGWAVISYDATDEEDLVSGFGLDVNADDANIIAIEYVAGSPYNIYPGTIQIDSNGIAEDGNAVAPYDPCDQFAEDTLEGLGTSGVTLEMAALYDRDEAELAPDANGVLVKLQVDKDCTVYITLNDRRGGVVLEDASAATVADSCCSVTAGPACWNHPCFPFGDSNADGFLTFDPDVQIIIDNWGGYAACADHDKDGFLTFTEDVQPIIDNWSTGCPP